MKNSLIAQIETQTGKTLTRLEPREVPFGELRYEHNYCYISDEAGNLLSLYVSEAEGLQRLEFSEEVCASLQYLNISENKNLGMVRFEAPLPRLRYVDVSECALTELEIPAGCAMLEKLYAQKNKLEKLCFEGGCPALLLLDLSENQLEELELPDGFDTLAYLYLVNNKLTSLSFPVLLPALDTLHLRGNQFTAFSEDILTCSPKLNSLYLDNNPLPDAMRGTLEYDDGNRSIPFLERYFLDLAKGGTPDNECKVLLIGNGNVGKSCLVHRLKENKFLEKWETTHAISLAQYELNEYLLNLWDFAGQDIYHATHRLFMQSEAIYLVLWDCKTEDKTHTPYHHDGEERQYPNHKLPYWLDYAWRLGKGSPVIVVQTKRGQHGKKDLPIIRETYRQRLPLLDFQDVELQEDDWDENGLDALLSAIRRSVKRVKNKADIPANWVRLRQVLRDKQLAGDKSMTLQEYLDLPEAQDLKDYPLNVLENWLVKTGVVFYRKGMFQDAIILDQAWAIKAIYTIFDRDSFYYKAIKADKGKFKGKDLSEAWHSNSVDERELFLSFMLACELCFEIKEKEKDAYSHPPIEERQFVAPQLLDENKPSSVEDIWMGRPALHLRYRHDFLHYGIIQSFIVRTQSLAEMRDIWRYGISLRENDMLALIETSGMEVHVAVTENGKPLLDKIRYLLEELQDDQAEESVSVDGIHYVSLEKLKNHPGANPQIETDTPGEWVDAKSLSVFLHKNEKASFEGEKAEEKGLFKLENMKDTFLELIGKARLKEALDQLEGLVPAHLQGEVVQLKSQLTELERQKRIGILSFDEEKRERAKITNAILELYKERQELSKEEESLSPKAEFSPKTAKVYFSYAWGDNSEEGESREQIVNDLYMSLEKDGFDVRRDKMNIEYGGLISEFMKELGTGDLVVVFMSDKYLRSVYCMWELCEIYRNSLAEKEKFVSRILPVRVENLSLDKPKIMMEYLKHWKDFFEEWNEMVREYPQQVGKPQLEAFEKSRTVKDKFAEVVGYFNDMNAKTQAILRDNDFGEVKNAILARLKGPSSGR